MMNQETLTITDDEQVAHSAGTRPPRRRAVRLLIVLLGIIAGQAILFGSSLIGRKILLPLDILAEPTTYLPAPERESVQDRHTQYSDLVLLFEPARRFGVSEIRAGRFPSWAPYEYCGVPFIWPRFSPFLAFELCTASPVILAWSQMLAALVAGLGAYVFFHRALGVGFWAAAISAWCYPLTAFFIFWVGYPTGLAVYWLPWILLAVFYTVLGDPPPGGPRLLPRLAPVGLSVLTALALVSGHLDVAGQVLLVSGLFALWCLARAHAQTHLKQRLVKTSLALACAWAFGLLLAAPYILPAVEYAKTGSRMERRHAGQEERPPSGIKALPQVVLPEMYGRDIRTVDGNQLESSAAAYAGVVATLFAAPLAFCSRRHRWLGVFWAGLSLFALSWCLNLPGFVQLLRLPLLNLMSHNRLVFAAAFSTLALAAVGLDVLCRPPVKWRNWFIIPAGLLAVLFIGCLYQAMFVPEPYATQLPNFILEGKRFGWIHNLDNVREVQATFSRGYSIAALWCGTGLAAWFVVFLCGTPTGLIFAGGGAVWTCARRFFERTGGAWSCGAVGAAMLLELFSFANGRNAQTDPSLYYPEIPVLKQLADAHPARVVGFGCLEANLAGACGLKDVRGYDGVDPARMAELLALASRNPPETSYAALQFMVPKAILAPTGQMAVDPVLDLLGVDYVIFRGVPFTNSQPAFTGPDYFVLKNPAALPRAFVPRRVENATDSAARLAKLAAREFDPREVAYVEDPVALSTNCQGRASIVRDNPAAIDISVDMATPGLVVLADRWDAGWKAAYNGKPVPILRANHAVRGVVVPAGEGKLEFRYDPGSFRRGLVLAGLAALCLLIWAARACTSPRWPYRQNTVQTRPS